MAANERLQNLTRYTTAEALIAEAAAAVSCVADINMCLCLNISSLQERGKRHGHGTHIQGCLSIKFPNKFWAIICFVCQMVFR